MTSSKTGVPPQEPLILTAQSRVAIIGGGFSGTMQAINLLRLGGPHAILIERRGSQLGRGVAYSAAHPAHLLNVRAANMSALPDRPDHFVRWLGERGYPAGRGFVPRAIYGEYLREMLASVAQGQGDRLELVVGDVEDVRSGVGKERIVMSDGRCIDADAAVLSLGNLPPHDPPGFARDRLDTDQYVSDPWGEALGEGLDPADRVLLIGTGLTAIDAALLLDAAGFQGEIVALSRRGLTPHRHGDRPRNADELRERPPAMLSDLVRFVRERAAKRGWRDAVDDLRPITQLIWAAAPMDVRARFLRHLRPYWDIHRHRLANDVADRVEAMEAAGRLRFVAGRTIDAGADGKGVRIIWRARGSDALQSDIFRRVINCTGPQGDLSRSEEPLLRTLLSAGRIRPDALNLGIDVDERGGVLGADGRSQDRLFAIGPMTRGALWEVVAVPDLRNQTWHLARRFSNQHWTGGEGL